MNKQREFQKAVLSAVSQERRVTPNIERFVVTEVDRELCAAGLRIRLRPTSMPADDMPAMIDERFRISKARWIAPNGESCQCDARIDETEDDALYLDWRHPDALDGTPWLELECFDFLFATERAWALDDVATAGFESYKRLRQPERVELIELDHLHVTSRLSESQLAATSLVGFNHAWLFGPPGTGKTLTSAVVLAAYLIANPEARVLIAGVSNAPLCQLMERLDAILQDAGRNDIRQDLRRYGPNVSQELRHKCPHLLPHPEDAFMPSGGRPAEVLMVRKDVEVIPKPLPRPPRLIAMTVAMAIQKRQALAELGQFDLLLIEEASQSALAQSLLLSSLAMATVYAGDPKQLSPVAKSSDPQVRQWMARSPMMCMPPDTDPAVVALKEQRRMAPKICRLVAAIGYNHDLFTEESCQIDPDWIAEHYVDVAEWGKNQSLAVREVPEERHSRRLVRDSSAQAIVEILLAGRSSQLQESEFLVLTPFRAQVQWIRHKLRQAKIRNVRVATVHRVQGKESTVVIFDPCFGKHPFLHTEEARRLMTVAFSRAKAKLILVGSREDQQHPLLAQLVELSRSSE
jgi:DNA replication ATP-dependent helicase Dna2